jgi:transcription initiation factor TFIID subunit 2
MNSLAESIAGAKPPSEDVFGLGNVDDDNMAFYQSCLEEIDRQRRIDEWIPSYHNILSATALDCKRRQMKAGGIPTKAADFLQYTQDGCYSDLRLTAFRCLMDLGLYQNDHILRWYLFVLGTDPSPYVRENLIRLFGKTLGSIAIGESSSKAADAAAMDSTGLIVEQESSTEARRAELARKQTIPGALAALKAELSDNATLKSSLWQAIESPALSLLQLGELLEICSFLYDTTSRMALVLKLPRYWRCINTGRSINPVTSKPSHILTFQRTHKVRTKPLPKMQLPSAVSAPLPPPKRSSSSSSTVPGQPSLKISLKPPKKPGTPGVPAPNAMAPPPGPGTPTEGSARPKLTLKLHAKPGKGGGPSTPRG